MNHLPKEFQEKSNDLQNTIVELGLHSWSLIEHYIDQQKNHSISELTSILKDKLQKQKEKEIEVAIQQKEKEYESILKDLTFEVDTKEAKCKKIFEEEKKLLSEKIRLDVSKEYQEMRDDYMSMKATLKTQGDFQSLCMKLSKENDSYKEQIAKLTETKSSALIGNDGEDEIESLLNKSGFEFKKEAKTFGGHKGDFHIKTPSNKTFILDSKKYASKNIPKDQKDQLIEDVDRDSTINGGILVSLLSGIANQENGDIKITNKNKPILFLSMKGMTSEAKEVLLKAMIKQLDKYTTLNEEKDKQDLLQKLEGILEFLRDDTSRYKNIERWADDIKKEAKMGLKDLEKQLKIFQDK